MLHAPNDFHAAHDNAPASAANQINKKKEIKKIIMSDFLSVI